MDWNRTGATGQQAGKKSITSNVFTWRKRYLSQELHIGLKLSAASSYLLSFTQGTGVPWSKLLPFYFLFQNATPFCNQRNP